MGFIFLIVFIIWYRRIARFNPSVIRRIKKWVGAVIGILFSVGIASSILVELLPALDIIIPILYIPAVIWLIKKYKKKINDEKDYRQRSAADRQTFDMQEGKLTKDVMKRKKFVEAFNKKYHLSLTDYQVETIVDASYISVLWEEEIFSMSKEYNSVYEWFNGNTGWLRTYLYVFNIQEVSSDFNQQKIIALSAFDQIFSEFNFQAYTNRMEAISAINQKYLTNFDEVTFMLAYRFLQANGKTYDIGCGTIVRNEDEAAARERRYVGGY